MAEKEYIERATTIKALKDNVTEMESDIYYGSNMGVPKDEIEDIVNEIPAADVVEVVRCKDCKKAEELTVLGEKILSCRHWNTHSCEPTDFCSYGERKGD